MTYHLFEADAVRLPLADRSVELVLGSPPYLDCRSYGIGAQRDCEEWIEWMLAVTEEALRVSRGAVFWVVAGTTRDRSYQPGPEGLAYRWYQRGGYHSMYRPCCYYRHGIPGSGGHQCGDYLRNDWEYVLCFKRPGKLPWSDATACGHPPKYAAGGEPSNRRADGTRVNEDPWGKRGRGNGVGGRCKDGSKMKGTTHTKRMKRTARSSGGPDIMTEQYYQAPVLANPGNVIKCRVGGGMMGHALAHENEASYPESLAEFFILTFCPPGGLCYDPFSGSATTGAACLKWNRHYLGSDIRASQVDLGSRRLALTTPQFSCMV
jgi:DNA methylase